MTEERRVDEDSRDRIARIDAHVRRSIWELRAAVLVLTIMCLWSLAVNRDQSGDAKRQSAKTAILAEQSAVIVRRVDEAVGAIQAERVRNILIACHAQNLRHGRAFRFLINLPPSPNSRSLSPEEKRAIILSFTDAVVGPVRDCKSLVRHQVPSAAGAPSRPGPDSGSTGHS